MSTPGHAVDNGGTREDDSGDRLLSGGNQALTSLVVADQSEFGAEAGGVPDHTIVAGAYGEGNHRAQKQQAKMEKMMDQLQKELHECRAAEKAERTKLAESRHLLAMQQDSINKLLSVKAENAKLSETVKNQELKLRQLKSDLEQETFMWKQKMEVTCQEHARRLEEQRVALQQKGDRMSNELIHVRAQLKALQDEKNEKINLITQTYEEKITSLENQLNAAKKENHHLAERSAASSALYNQKLLELEQKINSTATPTVQVDDPLQQSRWNSVELRETTEDGPAQLSKPAIRRSGVTFPAIRKRRLFTNNSLNCL
ncbi:epidermal growth factor receptor substrate 15 homolog [Schistocerca gregaria]|uniref:epidermal growth factor receptor substrate 15 homolog n=1 Tax=Schistocerca gregaria TaxID=7010 RepID=UPI00211E6FDC|nr:epidermal growth factor receptor substrate 15 homolog [Schistocerca gregaria]